MNNGMESQTEKDIRNITNLVDIENKSVLEVGCGTGRISFAIAEKVQKLTSVDIDTRAIEEAQQRNSYENVTFLVENLEDFNLGRKFDVILSVGVGYMYLKDFPAAIRNIHHHLKEDGVALLICSYPEDEYQRIVDLIVEENVKTTSFYEEFEEHLSNHFVLDKRILKEELTFSDFEEVKQCFQRELKEEYQTEMNNQHIQQLKTYFQKRSELAVELDSQAYICKIGED
ncbi:MAG: class I SAM-dependent methyltransferase [Candidatus Thorarchaeota archaeon]|jgi:SAM-dependent methyltransferase